QSESRKIERVMCIKTAMESTQNKVGILKKSFTISRFSSQSRIVKTSLEHRNRIKAYEKAVKAIERELKAKIEEERKKEIRRIQQKRQAKMERLIKEQAKKPLKQAQKSKGKRQRLSAKE